MTKKKGALSIRPEQRLMWLKRHEEGESVFKISLNAGVDHRTVKKHIEIARSERELKDERSAVLRNALERHFADLLDIVDSMLTWIDAGQTVEFSGDNEFLNDALHDHIPRSPIWPLLRRWNSGVADLTRLETRVRDKLESRLLSDIGLSAINERKGGEPFQRIRSALKYNPKERGQGQPELDVKSPEIEARVNLSRAVNSAVSAFIELDKKESIVVKDALSKIDSEMEAWEEFTELGDQYRKLADVRTKLKEALRILKWKRIVPGRCWLCPM
jgi:hypothetical protein